MQPKITTVLYGNSLSLQEDAMVENAKTVEAAEPSTPDYRETLITV